MDMTTIPIASLIRCGFIVDVHDHIADTPIALDDHITLDLHAQTAANIAKILGRNYSISIWSNDGEEIVAETRAESYPAHQGISGSGGTYPLCELAGPREPIAADPADVTCYVCRAQTMKAP